MAVLGVDEAGVVDGVEGHSQQQADVAQQPLRSELHIDIVLKMETVGQQETADKIENKRQAAAGSLSHCVSETGFSDAPHKERRADKPDVTRLFGKE